MEDRIAQLELENERLRADIAALEEASKMLVRRDLDLRAAYDELKLLDKEKSDFVSTAAHQLRTPLTSVRFSYQMLSDTIMDSLNEEQQNVLKVAEESVERMFHLIENLIMTDTLDYGEITLVCKPINLVLFLRSLTDLVQEYAKSQEVTIETNFSTEQVVLCIDAEHISEALLNILGNAIKYSPAHSVVTISSSHDDNSVKFSIADSGIGVPDADVGKLFRKFSRSDNARKVDANGSGLGLYISRRIIEKHGGTIGYTHNKPQGSVFTVTLPLSK